MTTSQEFKGTRGWRKRDKKKFFLNQTLVHLFFHSKNSNFLCGKIRLEKKKSFYFPFPGEIPMAKNNRTNTLAHYNSSQKIFLPFLLFFLLSFARKSSGTSSSNSNDKWRRMSRQRTV